MRTVQYVDTEVELEPGESPTQLMATALVVGGGSTASIVAALDWTSTEGLSQLAQGAQSLAADFPEEEAAAAAHSDASVALPAGLEGQRVELMAEGVEGVCVKHLVKEGRLRIKLDPDGGGASRGIGQGGVADDRLRQMCASPSATRAMSSSGEGS
eukprot:COSAG01_NODE_8176_length_2890_cov_24.337513_4_plen_156_part_00